MARTNDVWETGIGGTYLLTIGSPNGYDILINGTNHYLNFNATVGTSGYGIRDNGGTMEFKDSGGGWTSFAGSAAGVSSINTLTGAVTLAAGSGISLTPVGNTITIAATGGGTGDVVGPGSSTDNAVTRFDTTTGKLIQNSTIGLSDTGVLAPFTNDQGVLGSTTLMWSDLFLASGAVVNFNNGNMTITHAAASLTIAGGPLVVPTNGLTINATNVTATGTQLNYLNGATGTTGTTSTNLVFSTSPTLVTPVLGVASATSINKVTISTPATSATLTITDGKTLAASNSLTFAGTDGQTMTFPNGSSTVMTLASTDTITGVKTFGDGKLVLSGATSGASTLKAPAIASTYTHTLPAMTTTIASVGSTTETTNTATVVAIAGIKHIHTITALGSANTFGIPTVATGALDDTCELIIRIKDNATPRALTWNAVFRASSDLALPTTTVTSKTLYVGFRYNVADTKWDLVALLNNF